MIISFKIVNTANSDVTLTVDGCIMQSKFLYKGEEYKFSLDSTDIIKSKVIILENSDVRYDITEKCKSYISNYEKPTVKVEPIKKYGVSLPNSSKLSRG